MNGDAVRVGVISDTHGLLRPEVAEAFAGVEGILHGGDVDRPEILERLEAIAPLVAAVRGNVDRGSWAAELPADRVVRRAGQAVYMLHDRGALDLDPAAAGFSVVIYGHSHRPEIERRDGVLYLNPGSAGPRRFDLPVTVALLDLSPAGCEARIVPLLAGG